MAPAVMPLRKRGAERDATESVHAHAAVVNADNISASAITRSFPMRSPNGP